MKRIIIFSGLLFCGVFLNAQNGCWKRVNGHYYNTIAQKTDGSLWGWGNNGFGVLGVGDTISKLYPTAIGANKDWSDFSLGYMHAVAIKNDGTLWAWGLNNFGQLGLGNTTNYSSPKQVGALATWLTVAAGPYWSMAISS